MSIFENLQERIQDLFGSKKESKFDTLNPATDADYLLNSPIPVGYSSIQEQQFIYQNLISGFNPSDSSLYEIECGRGDLYKFIKDLYNVDFNYNGIDYNPVMVDLAKQKYDLNITNGSYENTEIPKADWIITSGLFTVKNKETSEQQVEFILSLIDRMYESANTAIAFNLLCPLSGLISDGFFYISPGQLINTLIQKYRFVNIKHDYHDSIYTVVILKF
jgi:hypothetical protein